MNINITTLPNNTFPYTDTGENALKSVYNNLQALYNILKKYEGVYFDSVVYEREFRDDYAYKSVAKNYTAAHDDEEIYFRNVTLDTNPYPSSFPSSTNYTVVADSATQSGSQIRISDVTPVPPEGVNIGDGVTRISRRLLRACANMDEGGRYHIVCTSDGLVLDIAQYRNYENNATRDDYYYEEMFEPNATQRIRRGIRYSIYNEYGTIVDRIGNSVQTGTSDTKCRCRAYSVAEMDNAIAISFAENQTGTTSQTYTRIGGYDLIITKSVKGKTVILSPKEIILIYETSHSSYASWYATLKRRLTSSITDTSQPMYFNTNAYTYDQCAYHEKTILLNIPCCGSTDDYVKDVFVVPFTQYKFATRKSNTVISINNNQFFYTGYFAIRG
jgi:hypothetical protein